MYSNFTELIHDFGTIFSIANIIAAFISNTNIKNIYLK